MPIEIVQVFKRPNIETPWFHDTWTSEHMTYIDTTYKASGKLIGSKTVDGELLVLEYKFARDQDLEEFLNDTYLMEMASKRIEYNSTHNIIQLS